MPIQFHILFAVSLLIQGFSVHGQELDGKSVGDMSIEELMSVKITVASNKPKTVKQSPGIVTLITSEDIARLGARDLLDVLMTVPGFYTGQDTQGGIGAGFRGLWAYSTKSLYMIDGIIMNEGMYETTVLAGRFPINLIDSIEIIRGPGSVRYGGTAELAVIKITTKLAARRNSRLVLTGARQEKGSTDTAIEGMLVQKGENVSGGAIASYRKGTNGEGQVVDDTGVGYSIKDVADFNEYFQQAQIAIGGFSAKVLHEKHRLEDIGAYGTKEPGPYWVNFDTLALLTEYRIDLSPTIALRPYFSYKKDRPWRVSDGPSYLQYDHEATRNDYGANLNYDPNDKFSLLVGISTYNNHGRDNSGNYPFSRSGSSEVTYTNLAAFTEASYAFSWAELTAGVRYDDHSSAGKSIVPRLAFVGDKSDWGYKVLLSRAFHTPGLEQSEGQPPNDPQIQPETATVAELEVNSRINNYSQIALNIFTYSINDPIIYDTVLGDKIKNYKSVGTDGAELVYQYRKNANSLSGSISYSQAHKTDNDIWSVPGHSGYYRGAENIKANLFGSYKISDRSLYVSPNVTYVGPRYGDEYSTATSSLQLKKYDPAYLVNLVIQKKDFLRRELDLTVGAYNIFGSDYRIIQPYAGGRPSVPGRSTEFLVKLAANF